jgi:hypothetical protein
MDQHLSIRRYAVGDEPGILKLFAEVFGRNRTAEEWYWQYNDNPWGGGWPVVGVTEMKSSRITLWRGGPVPERAAHRGWPVGRRDGTLRHRRNGYCARLMDYCYQLTAADGSRRRTVFPTDCPIPACAVCGMVQDRESHYFFLRIGFEKVWGSGPDRVFKCLCGVSSALRMGARRLRHHGDFEISVSFLTLPMAWRSLAEQEDIRGPCLVEGPRVPQMAVRKPSGVTYLFHTAEQG